MVDRLDELVLFQPGSNISGWNDLLDPHEVETEHLPHNTTIELSLTGPEDADMYKMTHKDRYYE